MNSYSDSLLTQRSDQRAIEEIDISQLIEILWRQKFLICGFTAVTVLFSAAYALTRKSVWEGQFQIVLEKQDSGSSGRLAQIAANSPLIANFAKVGGAGRSQLATEVRILKSPSVLKPTYEYVKETKIKLGEDLSNWSFRQWRDQSLDVELEKGTSVLNIAYRDTDPNIVLPVIKQISRDYQRYSGRDRNESISKGLAYAKEQVSQFRMQAANSSRALDTFAIRYGISADGGSVSSTGIDFSNLLGSSSSSSSIGVTNPQSSVGPPNRQGDAHGQLAAINQELIRREQKFTSRDPGVLALRRERNALRRYIELTAGGSLTLPSQQQTSPEQAQELILRFKELNRTAKRHRHPNALESSLYLYS